MSIITKTQKVFYNLRQKFSSADLRQRTLLFNNFAIETIFTTNLYQIVYRSMDAEPVVPTFSIRHLEDGREFYLVAKFITSLHHGKLNWCSYKQWQAYKQFNKQKPLFLLLGTGANPSQPGSLLLLPFDKIRSSGLLPFYVNEFRIEERPLVLENIMRRHKN